MFERTVAFEPGERVAIDLASGEFPATLATDGEASDGHILSIEGARFGAHAPLQISHQNDPRMTAGSLGGFRRELRGTPKRLRARGVIELEGEGAPGEIRRDLAHMMSKGHIRHMSVRWDPIKHTQRTALPKGHPAHVAEDEKDWRKRYGMFFEKWRVLEGSIVAVPADMEAVIGRAAETQGDVRAFWERVGAELDEGQVVPLLTRLASLAAEADAEGVSLADRINAVALGGAAASLEPYEYEPDKRIFLPPAVLARLQDSPEEAPASEERAMQRPDPAAFDSKEAFMAECVPMVMDEGKTQEQAVGQCEGMWEARQRELEDDSADATDAPAPEPEKPSEERPSLEAALERLDAFGDRLNAHLQALDGRVDGEPATPKLRSVDDMLRHLERRHAESVDKVLRTFRAYVDKRRGVVKKGQTIRDELRQEVDAVLKGLRAQEKESQEDPKLTVEQERKAIRARLEAESRLRDTETVEQLRKLQREIRELRSLRDQPHRDAIANLERRLQAVSAEASALLRASSA